MELCPGCREPLERSRIEAGFVYACGKCGGLMATLAVLRKIIDRDTINTVWQWVRQNASDRKVETGQRLCPACDHGMSVAPASSAVDAPLLDVCLRCQLIWLDAEELDRLPHLPPAPPPVEKPIDPQAAEALGLAMLKSVQDRQETEDMAAAGNRIPMSLKEGAIGLAFSLLRRLLIR